MNNPIKSGTIFAGIFCTLAAIAQTPDATITINAQDVLHTNSPYLTGACLEDVNHEIYGGLDSQMIFGESFAEPGAQLPLTGFQIYGGHWIVADDGSLQGTGTDGAKILWDGPTFSTEKISVDVKLTDALTGNGGLIFKVSHPAVGADAFDGYEVSLERPGFLVIGRHRQNWEPLRRIPCAVPANEWIRLTVRTTTNAFAVSVNGRSMAQFTDTEHPLAIGAMGLRVWQQTVSFRHLKVESGALLLSTAFDYAGGNSSADSVSDRWRPIRQGAVEGGFSLDPTDAFSGPQDPAGRVSPPGGSPFSGAQSQQLTFTWGTGVMGIANQGLNGWGMNFVKGKSYDGYLWARAKAPAKLYVALESTNGTENTLGAAGADGPLVYAEKSLKLRAGDWQRLDFKLTPNATDHAGRFVVELKQPGAVTLGYAFLEPGAWGRFQHLPVRKDVAEGLLQQGVTVFRYGGSMVNNPQYRWKKMIGPRAQRPPYDGHWYPYASNGWGIFDFLNFCEAAGVAGIPDLDINESPADMADFMEYLNGSPESEWGQKRVADGHPAPYHLKYLELGNEERVDENYFEKFKAVAEVIWANDPAIILIAGDFTYHSVITDPFHFTGADSGITSLAGQQKILQLAKQHGRAVWFDLHVWTNGPRPDSSLASTFSYIDALDKIADGAQHRVVIFELNADNHAQRRALANALAINAIQRDGRLPITCSANCLQPDGQNDNAWDQGLLFFNPSQVWLQPPGYVTQLYARHDQPREVRSTVTGATNDLDVSSQLGADGKILVMNVVNLSGEATAAALRLHGYSVAQPTAEVEEISGALDATNTAAAPRHIQPLAKQWHPVFQNGATTYTFQPHSVTVLTFD